MNIIVIPHPLVSNFDCYFNAGRIPNLNYLQRRRWGYLFNEIQPIYEYNFYSDLCGCKEVRSIKILGKLRGEYLAGAGPFDTHPSGRNCPEIEPISISKFRSDYAFFDFAFVSESAYPLVADLLRMYRSEGGRVAIIDHRDHETLIARPSMTELTRGLVHGKDFDVYFKKDIPLCFEYRWLYPLAPDPLRRESFSLAELTPIEQRSKSVFFSGIVSKEVTAQNRVRLLEILSEIDGANVNIIHLDSKGFGTNLRSNNDLFSEMLDSKFCFCPPGRSWTTTRLGMAAQFGCCPIVSEPNMRLVSDAVCKPDKAILFPNILGCDLQEIDRIGFELAEKIESMTDSEIQVMAENWRNEFFQHHSPLARAEYLIERAVASVADS